MNIEQLICAVLTGKEATWNRGEDSAAVGEFLDLGRYHSVLPLLDAAFRSRTDLVVWPQEINAACRQAAVARTGYEILHGAEIERVLAALARADIRPLILKGTGLAYSLYPSPALRPRADTDLLVRPREKDEAYQLLQGMGYRRKSGPAGRFVGYQQEFCRTDRLGARHNIDLHWRISNAQSFAWAFSFDDLAESTVPVPRLHPLALRIGNVHALALNLLHRAANNCFLEPGSGDCLIWHYDVHLLVAQMDDVELEEFRRLVHAKLIGAIMIDGLRHCAARFTSSRVERLVDRLASDPLANSAAQLLTAGRWKQEWLEWRAIPRTRDRLRYLAERAFPTRDYMRNRFPDSSMRPGALLYVQRMVHGFAKILAARRH